MNDTNEAGGSAGDAAAEASVFAIANVLVSRWKLVGGFPLLVAAATAIVVLLVPEWYRSTTTFTPGAESSGQAVPSGLVGLASQFGVGLNAGGAQSPAFYADLVKSRTLLDEILDHAFPDPRTEAPGATATLLELMDVDGETEALRREKARTRLREKHVQVTVDELTSVVSVTAETEYPETSAAVANELIELLNAFNLESRQSRARETRRFVEERVAEAEQELEAAEEAMRTFFERNREWRDAPQLTFEHDRLLRQVNIHTEVYTTLRRQYEEARVNEVNDTPVITVIDRAIPAVLRARPRRTLNVLLSTVLGGIVAVFLAFALAFVDRARSEERSAADEFNENVRKIRRSLLGPFASGS